jgi:hypothetical protein
VRKYVLTDLKAIFTTIQHQTEPTTMNANA